MLSRRDVIKSSMAMAAVARTPALTRAARLRVAVVGAGAFGGWTALQLRRLGADSTDLILVYDDIDLPLGTVRVRMKGSHGGHNGVRSVLDTLGTTDVRRVKLGIGRPEGGRRDVPDHVLSAFDPDELDTMSAAVAAAADRVLTLAQTPSTR